MGYMIVIRYDIVLVWLSWKKIWGYSCY